MAKKEEHKEINFKHFTPIQIRFDDIDRMGHVNNTVLLSYFDYGKLQYIKAVNGNSSEKPFVVIVRYEVDFFKPVFVNDEIRVETSIIEIGNKSLQFFQRICTQENVNCICKTIMSGFNADDNTSMEIPLDFKKKIAAFENNMGLLQ